MFDECFSIAKEESMKSRVIREFKTRIEDIYRESHNIEEDYDHLILSDQIDNLYKEKIKIFISKTI